MQASVGDPRGDLMTKTGQVLMGNLGALPMSDSTAALAVVVDHLAEKTGMGAGSRHDRARYAREGAGARGERGRLQ